MNLIKIYEKETGEKAMYRKGCSDYHTLEYVTWLETKINNWNCKCQRELQGKTLGHIKEMR